MATMMINVNGACREISTSASLNSLSEIEVAIKWFENLTLTVSLTFPYLYTKIVDIATMTTYFVRTFKEHSGTSPNSLEVK